MFSLRRIVFIEELRRLMRSFSVKGEKVAHYLKNEDGKKLDVSAQI